MTSAPATTPEGTPENLTLPFSAFQSTATPITTPESAASVVESMTIDPLMPAYINQHHLGALAAGNRALAHALVVGVLLGVVKARLPRGQYEQWVKAHCRFSIRHAQNYRRLANGFPDHAKIAVESNAHRVAPFDGLSLRRALAMLTESKFKATGRKPTKTEDRVPFRCTCPACGHSWSGVATLPSKRARRGRTLVIRSSQSAPTGSSRVGEIETSPTTGDCAQAAPRTAEDRRGASS